MTLVAPDVLTRPSPSLLSRARILLAILDPLRLAGVVLFVLVWQVLTLGLPAIILPTPRGVVERLVADFWSAPALSYYGVEEANLYGNLIYTAENVAIAVVIGSVIGILAGLLSARFGIIRAIIDPVMMTAGTVPILVAAPFLLIWFGVGRASAVCLVIFYVIVILYLFAQRAATNLDPVYEESARTLGATPAGIVRDILIPATVPEILGGLRIALAGAWGLEAIAELLGSQSGVGKVLEVLAGATDPQGIMATLLMLGLAAIVVDAVAAFAVARTAKWSAASR
ncbi:ABC transporter permease subunit [Kaistia dalseonensis]|uniref:ABC-type nitrate/sulfonate/bicarbonate transport system permease component n=1 Tax=Kaistia dalseonensis TaxID=410840 RepID=A0ABU0H939_9HYPH|nr:ABC transporter permease subunit [Kaistia dalseonensis]MCX5496198.1 ABC transporter permease subunit [Kaistia dalseonensis]MDQ0438811.1 ABC-type nitrate/sulfonate/bicarbonate transport system permease component [Kaistia dalseonensis]